MQAEQNFSCNLRNQSGTGRCTLHSRTEFLENGERSPRDGLQCHQVPPLSIRTQVFIPCGSLTTNVFGIQGVINQRISKVDTTIAGVRVRNIPPIGNVAHNGKLLEPVGIRRSRGWSLRWVPVCWAIQDYLENGGRWDNGRGGQMAQRHVSIPRYWTASGRAKLGRMKMIGSPRSPFLFDTGHIVPQRSSAW